MAKESKEQNAAEIGCSNWNFTHFCVTKIEIDQSQTVTIILQ